MEIITRRHLPHWYMPNAAHFVTYRVAGTIPRHVIDEIQQRRLLQMRSRLGASDPAFRARIHKQSFETYDDYLDNDRRIDWLARPMIAVVLRENLYHHRHRKYHLLAWCAMPNHVHVLLQPLNWQSFERSQPASDEISGRDLETCDSRSPLAAIMHSLKSYTANIANRLLERTGQFWRHESFDHWVRDDDELMRIVEYIAANPVRAGLCDRPESWPWCSARDQYLLTGDNSGWLAQA